MCQPVVFPYLWCFQIGAKTMRLKWELDPYLKAFAVFAVFAVFKG